jgi:hypothetical protein
MARFNKVRKQLAAIGVQFTEEVSELEYETADIEMALIEGAKAIFQGDLRVTNPIFSWIEKHGEYVNMERLKKLFKKDLQKEQIVWLHAFAFFGMHKGQTKWKILAKRQETSITLHNVDEPTLEAIADMRQLQRIKGELEWSKGTGFVLAETSIKPAPKYALGKEQLAKLSLPFRNRLIFGANWRADIITAIQNGAKSPAEVSKRIDCSYEPAHRVFCDVQIGMEHDLTRHCKTK